MLIPIALSTIIYRYIVIYDKRKFLPLTKHNTRYAVLSGKSSKLQHFPDISPKSKVQDPLNRSFEHATNSAVSNSPHIASHEVSKLAVIPEKLNSKYVPLCGQDPANTTSLSPEDF